MKFIPGFENLYSATEDGKIWSHKRDKFLSQGNHKDKYKLVRLNGKSFYVHRLVAMTYVPNPDNLPVINHKNAKRDDNRYENLEWCTKRYNYEEALGRGVHHFTKWNK